MTLQQHQGKETLVKMKYGLSPEITAIWSILHRQENASGIDYRR